MVDQSTNGDGTVGATSSVAGGFALNRVTVDPKKSTEPTPPPNSPLSLEPAIAFAQFQRLAQREGELLYHPTKVQVEIGDVFYLRQKSAPDQEGAVEETGVVVQVISKETATYQAAEQKSLFRLMAVVRADELRRSHHEPTEVVDEFMVARVRVRAGIQDGTWRKTTGLSVTRNVDIFSMNPAILMSRITRQVPGLDLDLGTYKAEPVRVFGGGFEKVNLITGMKGAGKSHIAKGIIEYNRRAGVSALVFDVNDNDAYGELPGARALEPGKNLKFRLDRMHPEAFLALMMRLAPPGEATRPLAYALIPGVINARKSTGKCPDISFLKQQRSSIVPRQTPVDDNMWASLNRSFDVIDAQHLIMSESEALAEQPVLAGKSQAAVPAVSSLSAALATTVEVGPSVLVIKLAGLTTEVQKIVVMMIIEHLKDLCQKQSDAHAKDRIMHPGIPLDLLRGSPHVHGSERHRRTYPAHPSPWTESVLHY